MAIYYNINAFIYWRHFFLVPIPVNQYESCSGYGLADIDSTVAVFDKFRRSKRER